MKSAMPEHNPGQAGNQPKIDSPATGLPFLRTWQAVYLFVLASFILWITLLIALTKAYS